MPMITTRESLPITWLPDWVSGRYYPSPLMGTLSAGATTATSIWAAAHYVPNNGGVTATKIGVEVTAAGAGTARFGLYKDFNGRPEELLIDGGSVDVSTTGWKEASISQPLPQGWIWSAVSFSVATTVRAFASGVHVTTFQFPDEGNQSNAPLGYHVSVLHATVPAYWTAIGFPELLPGVFAGSSVSPSAPVHTTWIPRLMIGV